MSYMSSTAVRGKNVVGSQSQTIMPSQYMFRSLAEEATSSGLVQIGEEALNVSSAYAEGPEVMDRRK